MKMIRLGCAIITMAMTTGALGDKFLGSVPPTESHYESPHMGWFLVNATLFNAPCSLAVKEKPVLTQCGAGSAFSESDSGAKTPAMLLVVDAATGKRVVHSSVNLVNGNNTVQLPNTIDPAHLLRLEVSYE
ncbi:hypothetical protein IR150_15100 [Providencia alcalifaciens]|uniref:Fimbrial protein n=4 Tax=Providencia alcalifaciens TaxID=126385 RepID=A0AAW9V8D4_9GAMM|nr:MULTISPECIES: hypothetical protein [Providencia]ATG15193.1 hypothetical protein CO695_02315 [Providencia alcalifaciens]EEB46599.1 hypothetical protein PROVALCAL_01323 [Providencia alcalifaciens DSM 30120]EKT62813.1 fimbrial protein [Providencia alcalifaciens Dmel2]ETT06611.1 hypothetical protein HMPREF1562_4222 [Providencia alcalifaciens F90-2004]EUC95333.1 hypothetical protein HMPREF1567_3928 [Providencia alcalifaciens PAL-2]